MREEIIHTVPTVTIDGFIIPIGTHEGKKIVIGADHRGFEYKTIIKEMLFGKGYDVHDVGTMLPERCDYSRISDDIGAMIARASFYDTVGIGICGTGIGIGIPGAKHLGVYPAKPVTIKEAGDTRKHNNTNFLCISANTEYMTEDLARKMVDVWLTTPFCGGEPDDEIYLGRFVQTLRKEKYNMILYGNILCSLDEKPYF